MKLHTMPQLSHMNWERGSSGVSQVHVSSMSADFLGMTGDAANIWPRHLPNTTTGEGKR
jgi:hypothetical protein